jgi:hypothetical protein
MTQAFLTTGRSTFRNTAVEYSCTYSGNDDSIVQVHLDPIELVSLQVDFFRVLMTSSLTTNVISAKFHQV